MITLDPSDEPQQQIAELLDLYASHLERGDESAAALVLDAHPELKGSWSRHLESLQALCRATRHVDWDRKREAETQRMTDGTILGDYRLNREIGRGGMGIVYDATQLSLRRSVALKVLPFAAVLDKDQVARFRNEAQAAALLHHPHIVPVFAVGCERGVHYYSMQLIDGQSLEQLLQELSAQAAPVPAVKYLPPAAPSRGASPIGRIHEQTTIGPQARLEASEEVACRWSPSEPRGLAGEPSTAAHEPHGVTTAVSIRNRNYIQNKVELVISIAEALDFAHRQGVVHRDVKPSNLLIDSAGKVWVADFGLARVRGLGNLTAEGKVMGTARYMSPEQIAARSQEIDHRTDIYSLGVTLYELLTLRPAFDGPDRESLFRAVEQASPVSPRKLNPAIPLDLETIVLKAIAKRKDERYASASDLAEDLRRFLDGRPTLARRPTAMEQAFRWAVRRQRLVASLLGLLMLVIGGLAAATLMVSHQSHLKELAAQRARLHLNQAHSAVDRFGGILSNGLANLSGGEELQEMVLREVERYYIDFLKYASEDPSLQHELAQVQYRLAATYVKLADLKRAEQKYQESLASYESWLSRFPSADDEMRADMALCLHNFAALQKQLGRYSDASQYYRRATQLQQELLERNPGNSRYLRDWAMTKTNEGLLCWQLADDQQSIDLFHQVLARLDEALATFPHDVALQMQRIESRNALAGPLLEYDRSEAEKLLLTNIEELQSLLDTFADDSSPDADRHQSTILGRGRDRDAILHQLVVSKNNLATLLAGKGELLVAIDHCRESITLLMEARWNQGQDLRGDQQLAILHNTLGTLLWRQPHETSDTNPVMAIEAFRFAERSLRDQLTRKADDPESLSLLAGVLHNLGRVHQSSGAYTEALDHLTEALELQAKAVKIAPFDRIFRSHLERHREQLDQILSHLKDSQRPDDRMADTSLDHSLVGARQARESLRCMTADR